MMKVVVARPPMFAEIDAAFHIAHLPVIFAWGDTIYNPKNIKIDSVLMAHESMHGRRQGNDVEGWWQRYIDDPKFRLDEEILAHQVEYKVLVDLHGDNRNNRRRILNHVASRLASPIYGRLISVSKAKELLS